ncbi:MAG: TonB-dependent receptor [Bacteroidota bacterium]
MRILLTIVAAFLWAAPALAQTGAIEGTVRIADGSTLPGATVQVTAAALGTTTDADGRFRLTGVPAGPQTVTVRFVGYTPAEQAVTVVAGQTAQLDVTLADAPLGLDQVVVTASRSAERSVATAAAVSVRPAEVLRQRGAVTAADAVRGITGVYVQEYTEGAFPIVRIRGAGDAGILQNTDVLVLIDGIPQVNINGQSYYDQVPLEGVERVEVVRGPTSALYGRNGIGGAINIITREAPAVFGATANIAGGSFATGRSRLTFGGPIAGSSVRAFGAFTAERSDGWRDGGERLLLDGFGRIDATLSERADLAITAQSVRVDQSSVSVLPIDATGELLAGIERTDNLGIPGAETQNRASQLGARLTFRAAPTLTFTTLGYGRLTDRRLTDDATFIDEVDADAGIAIRYPFQPELRERIIGVEPRALWSPLGEDGAVLVTVGALVEDNTGEADSYSVTTDGTGSFGALPIDFRTGEQTLTGLTRTQTRDGDVGSTTLAGYTQVTVRPVDRLTVMGSVRYDRTTRSIEDPLRTNRPEIEGTYERLSPQFSLSYGLTEDLYAFASYGEGFNPPWGIAFSFEREGADALEPEVARSGEIGVKARVLDGRLSIQASAYRMARRDLVQSVRGEDGVTRQVNAGALDVTGAELEIEASLASGLRIRGSYAYTDTEWKDFVIRGTDLAGTSVVGTPGDLASLDVTWRRPNAVASLSVDYVGSWFIDRVNSVESEAYAVVSLFAEAAIPGVPALRVRGQLFNALDAAYLERTEFDFGGNPIAASPGRPRWALLGLTYQLDAGLIGR